MTSRAILPLEPDLAALKVEISLAARRLRAVSRPLRRAPVAPPRLRLLRGGRWSRPR